MRFGSVCSGIEAASVAWHPLGWQAAWLAEIEPFPSAVLKHHYPEVPNYGDMTKLPERILSGEIEAPDLFCGGTPCQAFSVAGLRKSLDDARGNLSLTFCEIANAIDTTRHAAGREPCIVFWENVPGVLSTKDNAFGCFLGALSGSDSAIVPGGGRWTDAGVVAGPQRTVAWRTLDAQYFGLAQRRRRVFVVASARDGFDPATVLLECEGLRRDSAPSREAGQRVAPTIAGCANGGGANGPGRDVDSVESLQVSRSDWDGDYPHPTLNQSAKGSGGVGSSNQELFSQRGAYMVPAVMSSGQANAEIRTDGGVPTPTCLHEAPIVTHSLRGEGFDASEDGTGRGTPLVPVAHVDTMPTMLSGANTPAGHNARSGHTNDQYIVPVAQPYTLAIRGRGDSHNLEYRQDGTANALLTPNGGRAGIGVGAVAAPTIGCDEELNASTEQSGTLLRGGQGGRHDGVMTSSMQVRRLTPVECERLQGFPDGYTAIPWRNKPAAECPDGPRYKALGNSWAVPCVRWIGKRILRAANDNSPTTKATHVI